MSFALLASDANGPFTSRVAGSRFGNPMTTSGQLDQVQQQEGAARHQG
jgi:hypothetical protein